MSARAMAMMVDAAARNVRVVVLNACDSTEQADVLRAKVDCVVGMDGAIGDDAARAFAIRCYGALGNRRSVGNAVAHGVAALAAKQLPEDDPSKLVGSLVAQIEERFPGQHEPATNTQLHPAARLAAMLTLVSANELVPRGERLVVLIDGLDEYDPPAGPPIGMFEDRKRDARAETLTRLCLGPDVDLESAPQRSRPRCTTRFAVRAIRGDDEGRTDGPSSSSCLPGGTSP